jgi:hypothetical protein
MNHYEAHDHIRFRVLWLYREQYINKDEYVIESKIYEMFHSRLFYKIRNAIDPVRTFKVKDCIYFTLRDNNK